MAVMSPQIPQTSSDTAETKQAPAVEETKVPQEDVAAVEPVKVNEVE